MARNSEKAMTALARWRQYQLDLANPKERRPWNTQECDDSKKAQRFRTEILRDVTKKIAQIQNPGLGEFKIRDLNDEINKLLREKGQWEVRIKQLGGPDFLKFQPRWFNREGKEVPGMKGYRYFGAARDLPGVREILERPPPPPTQKTRAELMKFIDADYYGYLDDDDGLLGPLEKAEEEKARAKTVGEWQTGKTAGMSGVASVEEDIYAVKDAIEDDEDVSEAPEKVPRTGETDARETQFIAHVPIPSQKDVESALIQRKKKELMDKYVSETLLQQSKQAMTLMGYHHQSQTQSSDQMGD